MPEMEDRPGLTLFYCSFGIRSEGKETPLDPYPGSYSAPITTPITTPINDDSLILALALSIVRLDGARKSQPFCVSLFPYFRISLPFPRNLFCFPHIPRFFMPNRLINAPGDVFIQSVTIASYLQEIEIDEVIRFAI